MPPNSLPLSEADREALKQQLQRIFSPDELYRLLWGLPGGADLLDEVPNPDHVAPSRYFTQVVTALDRKREVLPALFERILELREGWKTDVLAVQARILDATGQGHQAPASEQAETRRAAPEAVGKRL